MTETEKVKLFAKFLVFYFIMEDVVEYNSSACGKAWGISCAEWGSVVRRNNDVTESRSMKVKCRSMERSSRKCPMGM